MLPTAHFDILNPLQHAALSIKEASYPYPIIAGRRYHEVIIAYARFGQQLGRG